jgi:hypothetical protein
MGTRSLLGRELILRELLGLERSLQIQTLQEVIQNSRVWEGDSIQNTQSHQIVISLKLVGRIVWILRLRPRLRLIYMVLKGLGVQRRKK